MGTVTAIQGVDDTLKKIATDAVAGLSPKPAITVGPLDRDDDELRLNWFLYRVGPNPAFRNMEPPATGWKTRRGNPPLALELSYLLTAFPASTTNGGDQEQFAHAGLAATMRALHENAIVTEAAPELSPLAKPLVEPLRITLDALDLEAITKIWTAASKPLRLSVGYEVSLVVVDATEAFAPGPPVRTRRVAVTPSMGPRLLSVDPPRITHGVDTTVRATGLTAGVTFLLAREPDDPAGPAEGWAMTVVPDPPSGTVVLRLPRDDLAAGARRLDAVALEDGLPAGRDSIGITVVPVVTGPATPVATNTPVGLDTAHAAADVEVFVGGVRLDPADVTFQSATQVEVTIPAATPSGPTDVGLRANKVAGPAAPLTIA
jgi:hypothetical protein